MANVHDVAAYILSKKKPMTAMKLQKLVYYCQAWSLVWDESKLFPEKIEAWANGPVVPELFRKHKGNYLVSQLEGNPEALSPTERDTIDSVLKFYGDRSSQWLSDLTHQEDPWRDSRSGLPMGTPDNTTISHAAMMEYYSSLT